MNRLEEARLEAVNQLTSSQAAANGNIQASNGTLDQERAVEKMGSDGTLAKFGRWSQQDLLVGWRTW